MTLSWIVTFLTTLGACVPLVSFYLDRRRLKSEPISAVPGMRSIAYAQARAINNVDFNPLIDMLSGLDGTLETAMALLGKYHAAGLIAKALSTTFTLFMGREAIKELRKISSHLETIARTMTANSSFGDFFPQHVFEFINAEISRYQSENEDKTLHLFFVYNPGTEWYPKFDALRKANPLPPAFSGCYHNLELLCGILQYVVRPAVGPDAIFHVLIPSNVPIFFYEPLVFPSAIGKLHITGELEAVNNGCPYIWMHIRGAQKHLTLDNVANIREPETWQNAAAAAAGMGAWAITGGSALLSTVALAPFIGPAAVIWFLAAGAGGIYGSAAIAESVMQLDAWKIPPRVLGSTFSDEHQ